MRVWIVNHYAVSPADAGGTRHFSLARELVRRGHEVVIVASSFHHGTRKETRLKPGENWKREVIEGVTFVWLRGSAYSGNTIARLGNMLGFAARVWRQSGLKGLPRPDVVVGSSPQLFAAWAAERVANRLGAHFLLEIRDLWSESLMDLLGASPWNPFVKVFQGIERYLYRKAERIMTLLPGAGEHLHRMGVSPEKVIWLPNGVDLSLTPKPVEVGEGRPFTVMYAGAHGHANGLHTILDAALLLQQQGWAERVRFRLIGDGPEKARLQERARAEGIGIIQFDPPVPKTQVYGVMADADAFIIILRDAPVFRWGVSPNKLYDYLAAGRPIIYGINSPYNPVAQVQAGLSIPPEDPVALAEAVKQLAGTPRSERAAMGQRGRRMVEEQHSFTRLGLEFERVLQQVTA